MHLNPILAPAVHLAPRQNWWDDVTKAVADVFDGDPDAEEEQAPETKTTFVVKTVTADPTKTTTSTLLVDPTTHVVHTTVQTTVAAPNPTPEAVNDGSLETDSIDALPTAFIPSTVSVSDSTLALAPVTTKATAEPSAIPTTGGQLGVTASSSPSASATATPENEGGQQGAAATAGIVIGVLAGVLGVFLLVWFLFTRRRKQMLQKQQLLDDEKINGPFADSAADSAAVRDKDSPRTPVDAPRLTLRPVTQFLPNFPDRRASRGANLMLSAEPQASQLQKPTGGSAWERPTVGSSISSGPGSPWDRPDTSMSLNSANPFNDNQRILEESVMETRPVSPISADGRDVGPATPSPAPEPVSPIEGPTHDVFAAATAAAAAASAGAAAGKAGVGLARKASIRKDLPRPLDLTMPMPPAFAAAPPSPAGTEYSMHSVAPGQTPGPSSSAAAIAAAGGPAQSAVHRVQLDFKPTMDDELALKAGQLVRLLHEYDDGWALCIRLDRSQQGVAPRTCLSTRPVKPRAAQGAPRGPPVNPTRPGYPPQGMPRGPMNGQYQRPQSPAGSVGGYNRPGSAASYRSQSPGPQHHQQGRPQGPNVASRRYSPPGPSQSQIRQQYGQAY
ncbi:hypothetical protein B0H67DRAFT_553830 [Lasiosphaeris hirsuta]|uniref:SH3 domain-containing protein n=1 Tax=Lasiosphaeris hirsuta TaxID=260670 RepID=A0AA40AGB2_9PEZI|nr:hypothetical protein B0H67DRAFT_553830 [Lasiosphaeris hirsuta]